MQKTAVAFETAMRNLDLITEQRFSHIAGVAELNSALMERAEVRAALEQTDDNCRKAYGSARDGRGDREGPSRDRTRSRINIGVAGLNLWIRKRDRAIEADGKLLAAERECREAQTETYGSRERIAEAMRSAGVDISQDDDVAAMLAAGQAALDRAVDAKDLRAAIGGSTARPEVPREEARGRPADGKSGTANGAMPAGPAGSANGKFGLRPPWCVKP